MTKKPTIKSLSADLKYLIERRAEEISKEDNSPKETLTSLVWDLSQIIEDAKHNKEDFKKNGLSVNAIEAEGFLRCALMINDILNDRKLI